MPSMTQPTFLFFFFNDTATTEIYTLSLHDALPISPPERKTVPVGNKTESGLGMLFLAVVVGILTAAIVGHHWKGGDRKSTRLNSSHSQISYAVFCLKKKKIANVEPAECRHLADDLN